MYDYRIDRSTGKFTRVPVSVGGTAGAGTQFVTEELDGDGDLDITVAGKIGVHITENLKIDLVPHSIREQEVLLNKQWPFEGEGTQLVIKKKK